MRLNKFYQPIATNFNRYRLPSLFVPVMPYKQLHRQILIISSGLSGLTRSSIKFFIRSSDSKSLLLKAFLNFEFCSEFFLRGFNSEKKINPTDLRIRLKSP